MGIAGEMRNNKIVLYVLILLFFISGVSFGKEQFSNQFCSFVLPDTLEIQAGLYGEFASSLKNDSDNLCNITIQQKGLNSLVEDVQAGITNHAAEQYCRILISCSSWSGELENLSANDVQLLDDILFDLFSSLYEIKEWNGVYPIYLDGYEGYVADYVRGSSTSDGDVHVYNVQLSTKWNDWNIIFSAREKELDKWIPAFREFGESFDFLPGEHSTQHNLSTYQVKNASKFFSWYTDPEWFLDSIDGVLVWSFSDMHNERGEDLMISVQSMDLGRDISTSAGKYGFLLAVQSQMFSVMSEKLGDVLWRVIKNSIDIEDETFTYRYVYSTYGIDVDGIIYYCFEDTNVIAFNLEWTRNYPEHEAIVDSFLQ